MSALKEIIDQIHENIVNDGIDNLEVPESFKKLHQNSEQVEAKILKDDDGRITSITLTVFAIDGIETETVNY